MGRAVKQIDRSHQEFFNETMMTSTIISTTTDKPRLLVPWGPDVGFGDAIQDSRVLPYIAPLCPNTVLGVRRELVRLFSSVWPQGVVAMEDANPDEFSRVGTHTNAFVDYSDEKLIPRFGDTSLPQLFSDDSVRLGAKTAQLRIGLCWHGSFGGSSQPGFLDDPRAIEPENLQPLIAIDGLEIVPLHFSDTPWPLAGLTYLDERGVSDFAGTASILRQVDLLITIDSAVCHLGGVLKVPTWLLLISPKHRMWDAGRWNALTPLYPSVRQFRQDAPGDWSGVVEALGQELGNQVSRARMA